MIGASSFAANTGNTLKSTQPAAKSAPVPLLWKVSDQDNSVYLLGSFHMLRADDYPLSKDVDAAYADAEEVVFEMPPEEIMSSELGTQMALAALRTDGSTLNDDLTPELAQQLSAWTDKNATALATTGMSPEMFQKLEPWFVGL
ncbi:MAG: TraB/GumN family protein, partial [Lysobacter sp.]|nr:TraB/GumN family protein [Lysobacter sp.]